MYLPVKYIYIYTWRASFNDMSEHYGPNNLSVGVHDTVKMITVIKRNQCVCTYVCVQLCVFMWVEMMRITKLIKRSGSLPWWK